MILQHHERLDGSGYPNHLHGDEIGVGVRVIAVADVVDAMGSRRAYRTGLGLEVGLKEIQSGSGQLFDSDVVDSCRRLFAQGRLQMSDG